MKKRYASIAMHTAKSKPHGLRVAYMTLCLQPDTHGNGTQMDRLPNK
ncbi:MAG: hypothetical protein RR983_09430 [Massilia sp.]|nr:hypothetical protein [Oxalobacteraceae sp. CFBP 8761]MBD8625396.1 hypothetical protein [Oxalobacteraceae sp. CFBP 8753]MBD8629832.1 hypothetical protein [Oxalobacteraceae sp. CFBP 8755]